LAQFCWGLFIVTTEQGKTTEISYSDARFLVTFSGVSYCGNVILCLPMIHIEKRKNIKTPVNLINTWGGGGALGYAPTDK
jgi:hypothetical protein